jgi:uncharacterized protein with HEPN domain
MRPDQILLLDMLLAAREAINFLQGIAQEEFLQDRMRQLAVIKSIEVIGEAAARISVEFRKFHGELPWSEIIGMRNRLVHGYFEVNLVRVWQTVIKDLPHLILALEKLVVKE